MVASCFMPCYLQKKRCQDLEIRRTGLQKRRAHHRPFPFCIDHANQSPYQRRSAGISIRNGSILANIHISTSLLITCHFEEDEAVEEVAEGALLKALIVHMNMQKRVGINQAGKENKL